VKNEGNIEDLRTIKMLHQDRNHKDRRLLQAV
jgi:hypothetical protein